MRPAMRKTSRPALPPATSAATGARQPDPRAAVVALASEARGPLPEIMAEEYRRWSRYNQKHALSSLDSADSARPSKTVMNLTKRFSPLRPGHLLVLAAFLCVPV